MIVFKKFGETIEIPDDDWKKLELLMGMNSIKNQILIMILIVLI